MSKIYISDFLEGDRLAHSLAVVEGVRSNLSKINTGFFSEESFLKSAELHDIGYSTKVPRVTGFHPLDGYLFLKDKEDIHVASTVLLHSDADMLVEYLDKETQTLFLQEWDNLMTMPTSINPVALGLISLYDMLTDSGGNRITLSNRHIDVEKRYGTTDYRAIVMKSRLDFYSKLLNNL